MSGPGTLWQIPGDRQALEVSGSTRDYLRLSVIDPHWPFPRSPVEVARSLCKRLPSQARRVRAMPEGEEALL